MALSGGTFTPPDWEIDYTTGNMVNKRTGQRLTMPTAAPVTASSIWSTTYPTSRTESDYWARTLAETTRAVEEYTAMRTFLQHCYPDVIKQFDVAYAAAKRIGVQNDVDKTSNP